MLEPIRAALAEIGQKYADSRIYHCRIEATRMEEDRCLLAGTVLDQETFAAVTGELAGHFPARTFDTSRVKVLRQATNQYLTIHYSQRDSSYIIFDCSVIFKMIFDC